MGDKSFLEMLLEEFVNNLPDQIETLRVAIEDKDAEALTEKAHALKGSSANLCADRMSTVALQLEQMGRKKNLSNGERVFTELGAEAQRLREYIKNLN